jgi:phosphotriesterase-related protein
MATVEIRTVTGTIRSDQLGRVLAHEHVLVGWAGWESDTIRPGPRRADVLAVATDRIAEIRHHDVQTMIDPCPNDLGRDVELMAEISSRTGFPIVCATGLYKEDQGGAPYWKFRATFGAGVESIAELYIRELTDGIGETGIRAGIIKVATGHGAISPYEATLLKAAAIAAKETGAPITTHTEAGTCGDAQQAFLISEGVPAHRIIVGHSCGSADHDYHMRILRGGSYVGFDRFGLEMLQTDDTRVASLMAILGKGAVSRVVVSHDTVWCWRGEPIPAPEAFAALLGIWTPTHFFERIIPKLKAAGATDADIETMLVHNPRRFFEGMPPPPVT